jgi:hypothetical protein
MLNIHKNSSQLFSYKISLVCFGRSVEVGVSSDELKQILSGLPKTIQGKIIQIRQKRKSEKVEQVKTSVLNKKRSEAV